VADRTGAGAVLEVDEIYLPRVLAATTPTTVVLLNLSRDQLDRTNEVRMVAARWRAALAAAPHAHVVANADDPLVVWGAGAAAQVHWVGAGLGWHLDAVGCPSCDGRITFTAGDRNNISAADTSTAVVGWVCEAGCGFVRPDHTAALHFSTDDTPHRAVWADGRTHEISLTLPGRFNHANALMAAVAAERHGIDAADSFAAMSGVEHVAGRFTIRDVGGVPARLMLAKNPAGWSELLELVGGDDGPVVIGINARIADGTDPSWLWDVPFERLAGRPVVATGDRCRDLSVRLKYADVTHTVECDPVAAVRTASSMAGQSTRTVDVIGNYTAFNDFLGADR
jgi:lipid II isoglutaminyl synthase (glutamine-hydrolysing)